MLREKNVISVKLTTDGTLDVVSIPAALNKDSYKNIKLQCLVPITENTTPKSVVEVYSSGKDATGQNVWTSKTYSLPRKMPNYNLNNFEYEVYEDWLPREFCAEYGDVELTFCCTNLDADGNCVGMLPSSTLNIYIGKNCKGANDNGVEISNYNSTVATVNEHTELISQKADRIETILHYDINDTPNGVEFEINGLKTPNIVYENVTYKILDMEDKEEPQIGSLLVTRNNNVQSELFIFNQNIAERAIFLTEDNQVAKVSEWSIKLTRQQNKKHIGEFLVVDKNGNITFTKALKDFITKYNGEVLGEDTSSYNFIGAFKITPKNKEEFDIDLSDELKDNINNAAKTIDFVESGAGLKLNLTIDPQTYVLTIDLLNSKEEIISSKGIDLPLESMVINGRYENGIVTLSLQSGQEIEFSISELIAGLVPSSRKINGISLTKDVNIFIPTKLSDLLDDSEHRTVTDVEKESWNNKSVEIETDNELSDTSKNPAQNKVITEALRKKLDITGGTMTGSITVPGEDGKDINSTGDIYINSGNATIVGKFNDNVTLGYNSFPTLIRGSKTTINNHQVTNGKIVVNPATDNTSNSYNEGIRINQASNGWSGIYVGAGGTSESGSTSDIWAIARRGANGSVSGSAGDLTIECGSSDGNGLTLYKDGSMPTWKGQRIDGMKYQDINATSLDSNTYYPVIFELSNSIRSKTPINQIELHNNLDGSSKPSWSTHDSGFTANLKVYVNGNGWGVQDNSIFITQCNYKWSNVAPFGTIGQLTNSSKFYIYVRGGGLYHFSMSPWLSATLNTVTVTGSGGESIGTRSSVTFPTQFLMDGELTVNSINLIG